MPVHTADARRLDEALQTLVSDHLREALDGRPLGTRARLLTRLRRHLPLDGAEKASEFAPPMWTLTVARRAGLPRAQAVAVAVLGTVYFSAADLADDIADGDLTDDIGIHVTDVCRLTFLYQQAIARIADLDDHRRFAIAETLARHGQDMADGQELDLLGTNALDSADPQTIARHKSGAEFAALGELIAIVGGFDRTAWARFGAAFGTGAQITSDYFDLFLDPESDDWATAKPTAPIRRALADPTHGPAVALLLAGRRTEPERKAAGLWHLVQADAADGLRAVHGQVVGEMTAALGAVGKPKALQPMRDALVEIGAGICEALDEYRGDPRPPTTALADEYTRCRTALDRFFAADPTLEGAVEHHRWGLFGADYVRGDLFGPLVVCDALLDAGPLDLRSHAERLLALADPDGIRYYPAQPGLPPDADDTGMLLRIAARAGLGDHPVVQRGVAALIANTRRDGLIYTWLADGERYTRAGVDSTWTGQICPVTVANALLGLWAVDPEAHRKRVLKGAGPLTLLLERGPPQCSSAFYRPVTVDALVIRLLLHIRDAAGKRQRQDIDRALTAAGDRLMACRRLDGRFGETLDTALAARALFDLAPLGLARLDAPPAVIRALIDAQGHDGGFPAERYFQTVGLGMQYDWFGARLLTAAYVHRTLVSLQTHV